MKNIRFRFYDASQAEKDGKKMTMIDRAIMLRSDLTHSEIQFDENRGGVSFSSTMADGADGCRFMYIQYSHPKRWRTLELMVSDSEEIALWSSCCSDADMEWAWQETYKQGCTYKGTIQEGQDVFCAKVQDITVYQGKNHIRYDAIGLLSFALEKSPSVWRNVQRWAMWTWTAIIKPDPINVWCSEECSKKFNVMVLLIGIIRVTEIDPQDQYDYLRNLRGVKEVKCG
jgi:hypothetical protein